MNINLPDRVYENRIGCCSHIIITLGVYISISIYPFFRSSILKAFQCLHDSLTLGEPCGRASAIYHNAVNTVITSRCINRTDNLVDTLGYRFVTPHHCYRVQLSRTVGKLPCKHKFQIAMVINLHDLTSAKRRHSGSGYD